MKRYVRSASGSGMTRGELAMKMVDKLSKDCPDSRRYTTEDMVRYIKSLGIDARRSEVEDSFAVAKRWAKIDSGVKYYG